MTKPIITILLLLFYLKALGDCCSCFKLTKLKITTKTNTFIGYIILEECPEKGDLVYDFFTGDTRISFENYRDFRTYKIDTTKHNTTIKFIGKGAISLYTILDSITYSGPIWRAGVWTNGTAKCSFLSGKAYAVDTDSIENAEILRWPFNPQGGYEGISYGNTTSLVYIDTSDYIKLKKKKIKALYLKSDESEASLLYLFKFEDRRIPEIVNLWKRPKEKFDWDEWSRDNENILREIQKKYDVFILEEHGLD